MATSYNFDQRIKALGVMETLVRGYQILLDQKFSVGEYQLTVDFEGKSKNTGIVAYIARIGNTPFDRSLLIYNREVQSFTSYEEFINAVLVKLLTEGDHNNS